LDDPDQSVLRIIERPLVNSPITNEVVIVDTDHMKSLFEGPQALGEMHKSVHIARMPVFAPLITPIDACGDKLSGEHSVANKSGSALRMQRAVEMVHTIPIVHTTAPSYARCVYPTYKSIIRNTLKTLFDVQKAQGLRKAFGM
jgi:hypothetical protein